MLSRDIRVLKEAADYDSEGNIHFRNELFYEYCKYAVLTRRSVVVNKRITSEYEIVICAYTNNQDYAVQKYLELLQNRYTAAFYDEGILI